MPRLYTYLPKDNTALTEGLLSTALSDKGFEKYRGRTGKYKKEDVLKVLDSWEPEWTRSRAISALAEPIPEDAADDFQEFARNRKLYSFDTKDLIKAKILAHIRRARKGGGTDPVDEVREERPNWHRKKKHLLFQGVPHYFVETTGGKIPPEFVKEEKQATDYSLKENPTYEDVLKVFSKLDFDDRANMVLRHPDSLQKVPDDTLFDRQVAVDGDGNPVGFNEFYYGRNKLGRRQPPHNIVAVAPEARGHGVARLMVEAAVRKARKAKIKRLVWEAFADNEPSIRAALSAGFKNATPKNAKEYRRFVYKVPEKKAQAFSQDGKTVTLSRGQTPSHVVRAYNKAHPNSKITVPQFLQANGNLAATKFRAGKAYNLPSAPATAATPAASVATTPKPTPVPAAPAAPAASAVQPRPAPVRTSGPVGFRRNNPLNLRSDGRTRWNGSTGVPASGQFIQFKTPEDGIRAGARTLLNYGRRHGINTVNGVLGRFAPASDGNRNNANYAASIQRRTGFSPDQRIDLTDEATLQRLVPAMGNFEIGPRYFGTYNPSSVSNAVSRAMVRR